MNGKRDVARPRTGPPGGEGGALVPLSRDAAEGLALAALDALHLRLCVLDGGGHIVATNRAWREFDAAEGADRPSGEGARAAPCMPWDMPCWTAQTADTVRCAVAQLLDGRRQGFSLVYECPGSSVPRWFDLRITRLPGDGDARLLMTHDDITAYRQAQERSAERLRQLGAHWESVQEEQRAMLARELHDEVGAALTLLKLDLASTVGLLPNDPAVRGRFDGLLAQVQSAHQAVKRLSSELRPATLDALGLMATIRWYVDRFSRRSGIATTLHLSEPVRLSEVASMAVFRILQEGLSNVAMHAAASRVTVQVRRQDGELVLEITDNGRGVTDSELQRPGSFGVIGMRERAGYLGGTLLISGTPGVGTQLTLRIPLDSGSGRAEERGKVHGEHPGG